jgi:methionine sulfoxide reductase heme-binding subunit
MAAARSRLVTLVVKPLFWLVALFVPVHLILGAVRADLGADPVETIQIWTGKGALIGLFVTLAISPIRRLTGWNELIRARRLAGLLAFFLATLHFVSYIVFDQSLSATEIVKDVREHPWVTAGFTAWTLLVPLALTSTTGMVRRLGGRTWRRIHQLAYFAAAGGVLHFLWLVKKDVTTPVLFGLVLLVLLVARLPAQVRRRAATKPAVGARTEAA